MLNNYNHILRMQKKGTRLHIHGFRADQLVCGENTNWNLMKTPFRNHSLEDFLNLKLDRVREEVAKKKGFKHSMTRLFWI